MNKESLRKYLNDRKIDPENLTTAEREKLGSMAQQLENLKGLNEKELREKAEALKKNPNVKQSIRDGRLDKMAETVMPLLDKEQQKRLRELIKGL